MNNQSVKNGFLMAAWGYLIPAIAAVIFIIAICSKVILFVLDNYDPADATAKSIDPAYVESVFMPSISGWIIMMQVVAVICGLLTGYGLMKASKASDSESFASPLSSLATMVFIYTGLSFLVSMASIISPTSKLGIAVSGALSVFTFCFYVAYLVRGKNCCALAYDNSHIQGLRICSRGYQMMWIGFVGIIVGMFIIIVGAKALILIGLAGVAMFALSIVMLAGYIQVIVGWFKSASAADSATPLAPAE